MHVKKISSQSATGKFQEIDTGAILYNWIFLINTKNSRKTAKIAKIGQTEFYMHVKSVRS